MGAIFHFGEVWQSWQHCGSVDVDFVLNPRLIDLKVYETIVSLIKKRGYSPYVATMERCFLTGFIAVSSRLWTISNM